MKKKLSIFILVLMFLPALAFLGCGKTESFYVDVISSWTGLTTGSMGGTVSGSGSYADGSTVTLTATAKPQSRFIAWIYEDSVLISNNETYSIKNQGESGAVSKSELSFKINKDLKGKYTAVFDDNKIVYTKLSSWRLTDDLSVDSVEENESTTPATMTTDLYVTQTNLAADVYSAVSFETKNNVVYHTETVNQILKLNAENPQEIAVDLTISEAGKTRSKLFKAEILFCENVNHLDDESNPYKITYTEKGTYEIVFKLSVSDYEKYLIIEYSNLNVLF